MNYKRVSKNKMLKNVEISCKSLLNSTIMFLLNQFLIIVREMCRMFVINQEFFG